jgi:anthranilate phosphoribosyltransferase
VRELGFGFMFAPRFHLAMRHVVPVRKELGVRTIFNFLGPLTNPAGATRQVIGVSDPAFLETIAAALGELGTERALVVSSADGFDEFSASGRTHVVELKGGAIESYELTPEQAGLEPVGNGPISYGTPDQNAEVVRRVFAGAGGPERAMAVLNAGAALYVGGRADTIAAGVEEAERALDSGAAAELLEQLAERSRELVESQ